MRACRRLQFPRPRARARRALHSFPTRRSSDLVLGSGLVPRGTLDNFTTGSLNPCTVAGKVYCLRNDLAQVVLWYNKRSEEHTSELQSHVNLVCRLLLEKKNLS